MRDLSALERLSPPAGGACFHSLPLPAFAGFLGQYTYISLYLMAAESYATEGIGKAMLDLERRERQGESTRQVRELIGARFATD